MGSDDVAIAGRKDVGILLVAGCESIVVDGLVQLAATLHDTTVLAVHALNHIEDADGALVSPIAFVALVEVFDVLNLVVADEGIRRSLGPPAEVVAIGQCGHLLGFRGRHSAFALGQTTRGGEGFA